MARLGIAVRKCLQKIEETELLHQERILQQVLAPGLPLGLEAPEYAEVHCDKLLLTMLIAQVLLYK